MIEFAALVIAATALFFSGVAALFHLRTDSMHDLSARVKALERDHLDLADEYTHAFKRIIQRERRSNVAIQKQEEAAAVVPAASPSSAEMLAQRKRAIRERLKAGVMQ